MGLEENNIRGAIPLPELDRCVVCGLCLPVCPTYQQLQLESASPRGRLALIRGLLKHDLPESADLNKPLSLCLQCRACEWACPAGVEFGWLIDTAKQYWQVMHPRRRTMVEKLIYRVVLLSGTQRQKLAGLIRMAQKTGLVGLAKLTGLARLLGLDQALNLLPPTTRRLELVERYKSGMPNPGSVYLFTGCMGHMLDPETLRATINVLTKLGYDVLVPPTQVCCGALHAHDGDFDTAQALADQNTAAFGHSDTPIISVVSGCGLALSEYGHYDTDSTKGKRFGSRVIDISSFLESIVWPSNVKLSPLAARVLVQGPCSLRKNLQTTENVSELLRRIPELEVGTLERYTSCCGGAGIYPIREPEMATKLRDKTIEALANQKADFLVSANLGCAMHIRSGLTLNSAGPEIIHPVTLIDRQLKN